MWKLISARSPSRFGENYLPVLNKGTAIDKFVLHGFVILIWLESEIILFKSPPTVRTSKPEGSKIFEGLLLSGVAGTRSPADRAVLFHRRD